MKIVSKNISKNMPSPMKTVQENNLGININTTIKTMKIAKLKPLSNKS